jgi:hypothetical protein
VWHIAVALGNSTKKEEEGEKKTKIKTTKNLCWSEKEKEPRHTHSSRYEAPEVHS